MALKIWPSDFEKKEHINAAERFLLRNALKNFKDGHFAIGIDPVGFSTDKIHMGMYINPQEGLLTFSIQLTNLVAICSIVIPILLRAKSIFM